MTATNHILAGSIIGALLPLPIAIPLAFASHFVMDAIPHYGLDDHARKSVKMFKVIVFSDVTIMIVLSLLLAFLGQWAMLVCGLLAVSPDFVWVYHYFEQGRTIDRLESKNRFNEWHQNKLQREHPWGIFVELAICAIMLPVFIHLVR
jgi:hypothetical protein